jgi:hypothetical protein
MARTALAVAPGSLVLGRYRPIRPLGSGGSGSVWLARDDRSDRDVALKIVARDGNAGARAEREARAAAKLRHERCLRARALARDADHVYIVYDYVPGRTLREAMRSGELSDAAALEAGAQILEGLAGAHGHGIVHRDVKPANVLLADGPDVSVKVFDFGLAVMHEHDTLTAVGDIPGTLAYISPERLRGEQAGPAADVWAVGVLLWEALAGQHPFWGGSLLETAKRIDGGAPPLATVRPDLGRAVAECVDRALSLDPARRPSAATLAARLRQAAARTRAPRTRGTRPRLRPGPALRRTAPAVAAVLFAAWSASALTFFPAGWALGIAAVAGALTALNQRAGLAFCLAVPVLPLGNYSLGLALAYALAAVVWFVLSWREPGGGLFLTIGPVLASAGLLVALPVAGLAIRHPLRRGLQVAAAVLAAAAVAGASHLDALGIAASESPKAAVVAVADAVGRITVVEAVTLAVVAVLLPFARQRGPWAAAGLAAFMIAAPLLAAPALPAAPTVVAAWMICIGLLAERHVRARLGARHEPPTEETVAVQALRPVQEVSGGG